MRLPTTSSSCDERFAGDRYERLGHAARVLAEDPVVGDGVFPFNADGLQVLVRAITTQRLLDHLSEHQASVVTGLLLVDFHRGTGAVAARVYHLLDAIRGHTPPTLETLAVISGVAGVLALMADHSMWCTHGDGVSET